MFTDSFPHHNGGHEKGLGETQRLQRSISYAHKKLAVAENRDWAIHLSDPESTYTHVRVGKSQVEAIEGHHFRVSVVPNQDVAHKANVVQLNLTIPTRPINEAGKLLQDTHRAVIAEAAPVLADVPEFVEPPNVPTNDIFGEAINVRGERIKFLLNPAGLFAYELDSDIVPASPDRQLDGQYYAIEPSLELGQLQTELEADWFNTQELETILSQSEPFIPPATPSAGSVA